MAPSYTMAGGEGPSSYSQNSTYQRALLEVAKGKIDEAISTKLKLDLISDQFNIGDFGCSVGPNTFIAVQNMIDAIEYKYQQETQQNPENIEFQVFFNDHSDNDFNTLFRTLPPTRRYFAAGVPGSFFGRVLPKNSLHIGHCSYSLHWLSRVPKGITDRDSLAWNKDTHCTGLVKEVTEAYLSQFKNDMGNFLNARAQELVSGGLLMLLGSCLPDGVQMSETMKGMLLDCAGSSLSDMVKLGLISQEKLDSFNMPIYAAHVSEFKQVIEESGCFTIEAIEKVSHSNEEFPLDVKFLTTSHRVTFGGVAEAHFGKDVVDKMMEQFEERIQGLLPELAKAKPGMQFFILLRRN